MSESGTIKIKMLEKGFGFIRCDHGQEHFFHRNGLQGLDFEQVAVGDAVCFELRPSKKKPGHQEAFNVRPASADPSRIATAARLQPAPGARSQAIAAANPPVTADLYPPYRFVPVNVQHAATDKPVWHDGNGGGDLLSGELLCTLTALTPLLPGNDRYKTEEADRGRLAGWGFPDLPDDKQIAEPLRLEDGRVVIPGSALKGMLRHSLGALLSAPMERVGERRYTYRPNLQVQENARHDIVTRPAVYAESVNGKPKAWILDDVRAAIFVRDEAIPAIRAAATSDGLLLARVPIAGVDFQISQTGGRILRGSGWKPEQEYCVVDYRGGIDGQGKLGARFKPPTKTYSLVLVPQIQLDKAHELEISDTVYRAYLDTQKVLANGDTGHLFSHALLEKQDVHGIAQAISASTALDPWQLIYVEVRLDRGKLTNNSEILSLGHHFRYRWAYTSSIRRKGGEVRACLSPLAGEALEEKKSLERPKLLSGSRLLFGYVHDEHNPIGAGVFQRLAGRIALNHALSESKPKFLGEAGKGWCIPLPILGQPKPSAWEFYLQQKPGSRLPNTYGDLPGDEGGDLAGRKFYRHQPRIRTAKDLGSGAVAETQATLARFICQPQTTFRFTLRFARLRCWELGALLAVLEPQRLAKDAAEYAHKLGLGRPLGMGSVSISIDRIRLRNESQTRLAEEAGLDQQALACLREKLDQGSVDRWLEIHRFVDRGRIGYPTQDAKGESTIYHWHTDIRKEYSKLRRERTPNAAALLSKILKGQNLPPKK